ncbi:TetR/AcrR family transcriptional regulator [Roseovarius sp. THAF27]|uniref:TetR/AcrR family transcriptional regulator n=1 Tax=Roseovarius sp. THAF27 TaxID=2587850 RepID=UPI0015626198|nr:TetR/AcrR family transcriptional regulator [Roseovarius sp. THAF27]
MTSEDWIECALTVLVESGIEAVQITALSRRLNVTRGSFYWHFESRESLLDALLTEWRARNTGVMVEALAGSDSLDDGILALFSVWVDHRRFDPRLDQAIRDWARRFEKLRSSVKAEDAARVQAIAAFFGKHGFDPTEAFIRARVIYFTQISYYALHLEEDEALPERMSYLEAYFRSFTGRDISPETAAKYRARILDGGDA